MPSVLVIGSHAVRNNYIITIFDPLVFCYGILSRAGYFITPCIQVHLTAYLSLHQYNFPFLVNILNQFWGILRRLVAIEPSEVFASASRPYLKGVRSRTS